MSSGRTRQDSFSLKTWAALVTLYLCWGSIFLANRLALEGFPPFLANAVRFFVAGVILYAWLRFRGEPPMTAREWGQAFWVGILLFICGSGFTTVGQLTVSSAMTATVVSTVPLWAVLASSLLERTMPGRTELLGMAVGVAGVVFLHLDQGLRGNLTGSLFLLAAAATWGIGSSFNRALPAFHRPLGSAVQMIVGGVQVFAVGMFLGERPVWPLPPAAILGALHLVTLGSIVGFSVYLYLLRTTRASVATSYAFTNPVIASFLGWWLLGEAVTLHHLAAMGVILVGVALVLLGRKKTGTAGDGMPLDRCPEEAVARH